MTRWNPTRRSVLTGIGGLAALGVLGGGASVAIDAAPNGLARSFDTNDDGDAEMVLRRESSPPGGRSGSVLNITSQGVDTPDYAVSLARFTSEKLTLGDLVDEGLSYDYYEGADSTDPGPDEVWVVIHESARGRGNGGQRHALFRKEEDDRGAEQWRTRDVTPELEGDFRTGGSGEPWKEFHVNGRSIETVGDDVVDIFGRDATVKWAGVGRGSPGWKSFVADTYYDRFTAAGNTPTLPVKGVKTKGGK